MATIQPLSAPAGEAAVSSEPIPTENVALEKTPSRLPEMGDETAMLSPESPFARLPVELDVVVPVPAFRVRNLLALEPGRVIETHWGHGQDVPLAASDVQLAWSEFEVVDSVLAVRLTRLV